MIVSGLRMSSFWSPGQALLMARGCGIRLDLPGRRTVCVGHETDAFGREIHLTDRGERAPLLCAGCGSPPGDRLALSPTEPGHHYHRWLCRQCEES